MIRLSDDVFSGDWKGRPTRALLQHGSGSFSVSGPILNQLFQERVHQPQFIDYHVMYDTASGDHYIVLRYIGLNGMVLTVHSDAVVIEEYILEPSLLNMQPGEERCFTRFGMTFTLKAEARND